MDVFNAIAMKLIIGLGIAAGVTGLLIYFSCRCFPAWKYSKKITNNAGYKKFFKIHCNFWWLFWALIIMHILAVIFYFYTPF
jgi:cytochrome b561